MSYLHLRHCGLSSRALHELHKAAALAGGYLGVHDVPKAAEENPEIVLGDP